MLDWGSLEERRISKLYWQEGYYCRECFKWNGLFFTTLALKQSLDRLKNMRPDHTSFLYHFLKTLKRAETIQERGRKETA